jgi:hypothetical protein
MQQLTRQFVFFVVAIAAVASIRADALNLAATIFTESDAQQVYSGEVEPANYNQQPDKDGAGMHLSRCGYSWKKKSRQVAHVDLELHQWKTAEMARTQFDSIKQVYRGTDVSGMGDAAFRSSTPAQLHILKGRMWISVTANTFKPDPAMADQVAAVALRRLRD